MATTQDRRLLSISTPLEKDFLLLESFEATEGISQLFSIDAELVFAEEDEGVTPEIVDPKSLLGGCVSISVSPDEDISRQFSGIVNRFSQGIRNGRFTHYQITVVPRIWVMTKRIRSQIFQQKSVPEILKKMFDGFDVKYELQKRTYEPRNYCVQYRESDFAFVSRLMEEEGIYYFFTHADGADKLVVADTPQSHVVCPTKNQIRFHTLVEQLGEVSAIRTFNKGHFLKSGKVTLWDHNFELPGKTLEREELSKHTYGDNKKLEIYDFPGGYAKKFDGISSGGGEQSGELQKIFPDRDQITKLWMEGIDSEVEVFSARGDCCTITPGHQFTLAGHPNSAFNSPYVITSVQHSARQSPSFMSELELADPYVNMFTCIGVGSGQPCFRPPRVTPKPRVHGSQTAYVVGPAGEEIHVDKYGRVKVQFHWDRDGQANESSSCWTRVAQMWAGNKWGGMFIPRIGQEVIVHFLEGDPDQPIISGCVYNAGAMPPYTLPDEKTKSTLKSNSSKGGDGFNEFRFEDKKGKEQIFVHAEKNVDVRVKNDYMELIKHDRHLIIENEQFEEVKKDKHLRVRGDQNEQVDGSVSLKVGSDLDQKIGSNYAHEAGQGIHLKAGTSAVIEAGAMLTLKVGGNFININSGGIFISGTIVNINSGGSAGSGAGASPDPPKEPKEADNAEPGNDPKPPPRRSPPAPVTFSPMAVSLKRAAESGTPFCAICAQIRKEREEERKKQQQQQNQH